MARFTKDTSLTLVSRVICVFTGLATSIIIARILGPEGKGVYSLSILLPLLLINFLNLGIGSATVYYTGKRKYALKKILGNNLIIGIIISGIAILVGIIIIIFFRELFFEGVSSLYLFISLGLIPMSLMYIYLINILLGIQKIAKYNLVAISRELFSLILVVIMLVGFKTGVIGGLSARIIATLLAVIIAFWWIVKLSGGIACRLNKGYIKDTTFYGIKAHTSNILAFLNYRLDMFLVNFFINPLAVGYYSISVGIAERLWLVSRSASTVLFPRVASEKDENRRKEFTPIVSRNVLFITFVGAIFIYFLSRWAILLLYSEAYLASVRPLQLLLPGIVALSISRVLANDIAGRGKPILNTYMSAVTISVNIGLNILWIPTFGIEGAALASTVSYIVQTIGRLLIYRKISGNSIIKTVFVHRSDLKLYKRFILSVFKR
ncbi:oligosaccharide flippase family protein [candidate division WOR-3 bacterium]|nr:oligosaccharide flippase family protein [candidate division WOR-3 bacterium]